MLAAAGFILVVVEAIRTFVAPQKEGTDAAAMYLFSLAIAGTLAVGLLAVCVWQAFRPVKSRDVVPPPAGWYRDPWAANRVRYWDGWCWTEHSR